MSERIIVAKWWTPLSKAPAARKTRRTADHIPITETLTRMENQKEVNYQRAGCITGCRVAAVAGKQTVGGSRGGWVFQRPGLA